MALDWRKAKVRDSLNLLDENDSIKRDSAARWLEENDPNANTKKKARTKGARGKPRLKKLSKTHHKQNTDGVIVYTDGACEPNPGVGGWGYVVYRDGVEIHSESGGDRRSTNNIMEMTAMLRALEWLDRNGFSDSVVIYSDSQYVVKGCTLWRHGWRRKMWRKGSGGKIANIDLWKTLSSTLDRMSVKIEWCKGHSGIVGNERADELSVEGRISVESRSKETTMVEQQLRYSI